ncbi:DNA polymerase ligase-domain-containing protein [Talaromyces proteolyticus]|uniref:DNA polymerase ligase-domain-containing protein n=1 Tax=Talaromyces proteolyticus TaxID=1131652 RepID=A0AAD4KZ50_9EURO|nr:DNA polymerase ligase-domain-containing protein [Talaromyces proteolyticus]KAH8703283.1 DNA polymerase ligase-domain-containing protein [Talaromyces proteolyticus]
MKRSHLFASEELSEGSSSATGVDEHTHTHAASVRLSSLSAPVSPPRRKLAVTRNGNDGIPNNCEERASPNLAAVEAGQVKVDDHVKLFSTRLAQASRPEPALGQIPRLSIDHWIDLYLRNQHADGHHFVIHQHDHPIAGPHYDLRLQFSESSSLSWAIMYGLPGDPNSQRINRNATETRVHCVWNHLIETGSVHTGSMIIWDTGEYEILPYYPDQRLPETDDSSSDASQSSLKETTSQFSESEKLKQAFQNRKIRLRLHGTRLPKGYTIALRLSSEEDKAAREKPTTKKRRRRHLVQARHKEARTPSTSRSPSPNTEASRVHLNSSIPKQGEEHEDIDEGQPNLGSDSESIDSNTRLNNAYPGATNSVGSIHQRKWYISLDRHNSGFVNYKEEKRWKRKSTDPLTAADSPGFSPFYVRGPETERSVITGRTGYEVFNDEKVYGFIPRRGWRPILN